MYDLRIKKLINTFYLCAFVPLCLFLLTDFNIQASDSLTIDSLNTSYSIREKNILFVFRGTVFIIPLQDFTIDKFLKNSVLYIPNDLVRDGLP